mmetsp:Transcript_39722/g.102305  ORF Transcript_39722/g.102305 Transcript_39722/m.102305 type:complete len:135 (-) Transcript_39722:3208-3612(-)
MMGKRRRKGLSFDEELKNGKREEDEASKQCNNARSFVCLGGDGWETAKCEKEKKRERRSTFLSLDSEKRKEIHGSIPWTIPSLLWGLCLFSNQTRIPTTKPESKPGKAKELRTPSGAGPETPTRKEGKHGCDHA